MRLAFCLSVRGFTSPPIHQSLAANVGQEAVGSHGVVAAQARAVGIAEVELGKVARQVRFRDVVERADDAALEDREVVFDGVGVMDALADILAVNVIDGAMGGNSLPRRTYMRAPSVIRCDFRLTAIFLGWARSAYPDDQPGLTSSARRTPSGPGPPCGPAPPPPTPATKRSRSARRGHRARPWSGRPTTAGRRCGSGGRPAGA